MSNKKRKINQNHAEQSQSECVSSQNMSETVVQVATEDPNLATSSQNSILGNRNVISEKETSMRFMNGPRSGLHQKAYTKKHMMNRSGSPAQNRKISDFFKHKPSISVDPTAHQGSEEKVINHTGSNMI